MTDHLLRLLGITFYTACRTRDRRGWRASWHTKGNSYTLEFYLFHFDAFMGVEFSDTYVGDHELMLSLAFPFLLKLYLGVRSFPFSQRLPGVDYKGWGTGEREIRFKFHSWALWWNIWTDPKFSDGDTWREGRIKFLDLLFGRLKILRVDGAPIATTISLPEGSYPCTATPSIITRWRPRLPYSIRHQHVINISVDGGVPVPGDGENDYDIDDDAILEHSCNASSLSVARLSFCESVIRQRRHDYSWKPSAGWPTHLVKA